jgi:hypothetical protein
MGRRVEVPGVVLEMVSGEWKWGGHTCLGGFAHSCAPNDKDNDVVVIVFAVINSRGARGSWM